MPGITLNPVDAAELAETLTFLTQWLSGSQKQARRELHRLHRPAGGICLDLELVFGYVHDREPPSRFQRVAAFL